MWLLWCLLCVFLWISHKGGTENASPISTKATKWFSLILPIKQTWFQEDHIMYTLLPSLINGIELGGLRTLSKVSDVPNSVTIWLQFNYCYRKNS